MLKTFVNGKQNSMILHNVYYVSDIRKNLMSVSQIEKRNKALLFKEGKVLIMNTITGRTAARLTEGTIYIWLKLN